jgi:hypothetical protein
MARSPKPPVTPSPATEVREVSFSIERLKEIIAEANEKAVEKATAALKAEMQQALAAKPQTVTNGKTERSLKNEIAVVKAFKKAGFGVVIPHLDVMTFNRWMAKGFRPLEGSKSLRVLNLRLFHKTQVRSITPEERAELEAQSAAAIARHQAASNVTQLNPQ